MLDQLLFKKISIPITFVLALTATACGYDQNPAEADTGMMPPMNHVPDASDESATIKKKVPIEVFDYEKDLEEGTIMVTNMSLPYRDIAS